MTWSYSCSAKPNNHWYIVCIVLVGQPLIWPNSKSEKWKSHLYIICFASVGFCSCSIEINLGYVWITFKTAQNIYIFVFFLTCLFFLSFTGIGCSTRLCWLLTGICFAVLYFFLLFWYYFPAITQTEDIFVPVCLLFRQSLS